MLIYLIFLLMAPAFCETDKQQHIEENREENSKIVVVDMSKATTWKDLSDYYTAVEKRWKICVNCGVPGLGTAMHLDYVNAPTTTYPAVIPTEYLVTRLNVIDVSSLAKMNPSMILTLDVALQWMALKYDPKEPTLLLFKFGWREEHDLKRTCVCEIPGLSYDLAEWIAMNLSHVVGVATDAPSLESEQTREFTSRTISKVLGKGGIYMIENVNVKAKIPDSGCMTIAMPLMLLHNNYVPTRLTAFCPNQQTDKRVTIALKKLGSIPKKPNLSARVHDINLEEIMSK